MRKFLSLFPGNSVKIQKYVPKYDYHNYENFKLQQLVSSNYSGDQRSSRFINNRSGSAGSGGNYGQMPLFKRANAYTLANNEQRRADLAGIDCHVLNIRDR